MDQREQFARQKLADVMKRLYGRGLISIYGGNASVLLDDNSAVLITPSGFNKENLREEDLVKVDFVSGTAFEGKPSSELKTHMSIYKASSVVRAVVHAHPPTLVGLCTSGFDFGVYTPEQALLVGKPGVIDFCLGERLAETVSALAGTTCQAVVVKNHGVFSWGKDLTEAYAKIEILEEAAKMVVAGGSVVGSGMSPLSREQVENIIQNYKPSH